ncbi:MAG: hypothetical protein OEY55_03375 [Acidimicrobiia bacterium]|nr:hypothetical protein [Acidimicrobiia bacterium]MDH5503501.1 hypothetical protein [Acidimicrobiia bacterium]
MTVSVTARHATSDDIPALVRLYGELEQEMDALHVMWKRADALPQPIDEAFAASIESPDAVVIIGELDDLGFGFLIATVEPLVDGSLIGAIRFIFTEQAAREVGVAAAMLALALAELRSRGLSRFDAHVLPGHRLVKNFFEAGGFSARTIVMHHDDNA